VVNKFVVLMWDMNKMSSELLMYKINDSVLKVFIERLVFWLENLKKLK